MKPAEIIAVGSELLIGGRIDTNSLFLTRRLGALGIEVRYKSVVGDDEAEIALVLRIAVRRARVIIITGGLGPTLDDRTRYAVARVTGRPLRRRREALLAILERLSAWGRVPTIGQWQQALLPSESDLLPNPVGTAPGFLLRWRGAVVAVLPGVPREAEEMFDRAVVPRLGVAGGQTIESRVLHTFGLPEADVDRHLTTIVSQSPTVQFGVFASPLGVTVSLTARGLPRDNKVVLDRTLTRVRRRLGKAVFAWDDDTMELIVGRLLAEQGVMLALAESCTGGLIGHRLTQVPGSSAYLDRGIVTYSNEAKVEVLGVRPALLARHGAVSAEVAAAMARGVRIRSRADAGLSVTGIAGPGGGSARKPVGLVYVGLDARVGRRGTTLTREFRFHGDRHTIKLRASQAALNILRLWLEGLPARRPH